MPSPDPAAGDMIGMPGSFSCHNVVGLWAEPVAKHLDTTLDAYEDFLDKV